MAKAVSKVLFLISALVVWFMPVCAYAVIVNNQMADTDVTLVKQTRINRNIFENTYRFKFFNSGNALKGLTVKLQSSSPYIQVVDGFISVGDIAAGAEVTSADTITVRIDRLVSFDTSALTWEYSVPYVGERLSGAPNSPAVDALEFRIGETPEPNSFENGFIPTRLTATIAIDATVEQVNTALNLVNGYITGMISDFPVVDIGFPAAKDEVEAELVAKKLVNSGAFSSATPTYVVSPIDELPDSMINPIFVDAYLAEMRVPAMWNIRDGLSNVYSSVVVSIADSFNLNNGDAKSNDLISHRDIDIKWQGYYGDSGQDAKKISTGNHGWLVAGIIGAKYNDLDVTGVIPRPDLVEIEGVLSQGQNNDTWDNMIRKIFRGLGRLYPECPPEYSNICIMIPELWHWDSTDKKILNTSLGYNDSLKSNYIFKYENYLKKLLQGGKISQAKYLELLNATQNGVNESYSRRRKAEHAMIWRKLFSQYRDKFIHVASAGNDYNTINNYPVDYNSPWNLASRRRNPCDIILEKPSDFDSSTPIGTVSESNACNDIYQKNIIDDAVPMLDNVIIVGSKQPDIHELSNFSNQGVNGVGREDVVAVGEGINSLCVLYDQICPGQNGVMSASGTSMTAPQVSGIAATLWQVNSGLTVQDVISIIKNSSVPPLPTQNPVDFKLVDAYNAVRTATGESFPIRFMNVVGAHYFDANSFDLLDVENYLELYALSQTNMSEDYLTYSRYDLNGDGYTGGSHTMPFNLNGNVDSNFKPIYEEEVTVNVEPYVIQASGYPYANKREFNEYYATDMDILCYYAFSLLAGNNNGETITLKSVFDKVNKKYGTNLSCFGDGVYLLNKAFVKNAVTVQKLFNDDGSILTMDTSDPQDYEYPPRFYDCSVNSRPIKLCKKNNEFQPINYLDSTDSCANSLEFDGNLFGLTQSYWISPSSGYYGYYKNVYEVYFNLNESKFTSIVIESSSKDGIMYSAGHLYRIDGLLESIDLQYFSPLDPAICH